MCVSGRRRERGRRKSGAKKTAIDGSWNCIRTSFIEIELGLKGCPGREILFFSSFSEEASAFWERHDVHGRSCFSPGVLCFGCLLVV